MGDLGKRDPMENYDYYPKICQTDRWALKVSVLFQNAVCMYLVLCEKCWFQFKSVKVISVGLNGY